MVKNDASRLRDVLALVTSGPVEELSDRIEQLLPTLKHPDDWAGWLCEAELLADIAKTIHRALLAELAEEESAKVHAALIRKVRALKVGERCPMVSLHYTAAQGVE